MASSGNYALWNPLRVNQQTQTFAEGNLRFSSTQTSTNPAVTGSFGVNSGKWYWEVIIVAEGNASNSVGVCTTEAPLEDDTGALWNATGDVVFMYLAGGNKRTNATSTSYGNSWTTNDIMQVALDMDNGAVYFGKNNTFQNSGNPASGASKTGAAFTNLANKGHIQPYSLVYNNGDQVVNFGQDSSFAGRKSTGTAAAADGNGNGDFFYAPPSDYLALCSANLPTSSNIDPAETDDDIPSNNFGVVTYSGTQTAGTAITVGFQPDLIWTKIRVASDSRLVDSSRGNTKFLISNNENAESTSTTGVTSFTSTGYVLGADQLYNGVQSGVGPYTYVAWCWRANGGTTTSFSDNINGNYQANAAGGFSIITYTGTGSTGYVNHGLGVAPNFILSKDRGVNYGWNVYLKSGGVVHSGYDSQLYLNSANDLATNQQVNVVPDSTKITMAGNEQINKSTNTYVMYAWADVEGYQKFGIYEGNNNANGSFVYTGFKPRMLFVKSLDADENWVTFDSERDVHNPAERGLFWNANSAESTGSGSGFDVDFLANGFKMRCNHDNLNGDSTYVFGAWGDVPFKYNNTHP